MTNKYQFYVVNAFSDSPFAGNPAAIFPDSEALTETAMQAIAKQLNLVETVFVSPSIEADFRLRYFTPEKELPIAGHPTIATWAALALNGHIDCDEKNIFIQQTNVGLQKIEIEKINGLHRVLMEQPKPRFLREIHNRSKVAEIFSIQESEIVSHLPIQAVDTGLGHIIFGVSSLDSLMKVKRSIFPLKSLCEEYGVSEAQIYCEETYDPKNSLHTRNICPREGIEDPACGMGSSALLAYLMKHEVLSGNRVEILAEQGHIENMPSVIFVRGIFDSDKEISLTIGGTGIMMVKGEFFI